MSHNWKNVKTKNVSTECICPTCGATHKKKIFFTGRGKPRIFCGKDGNGCANPSGLNKYHDDIEIEYNLYLPWEVLA